MILIKKKCYIKDYIERGSVGKKSRLEDLLSYSAMSSRTNFSLKSARKPSSQPRLISEPTYMLKLKNYTFIKDDELSPNKNRIDNLVDFMSRLESEIPLASDLLMSKNINSITFLVLVHSILLFFFINFFFFS